MTQHAFLIIITLYCTNSQSLKTHTREAAVLQQHLHCVCMVNQRAEPYRCQGDPFGKMLTGFSHVHNRGALQYKDIIFCHF